MAEFAVFVLREVYQQAFLVVDAVDRDAAEAEALARAETDETLNWAHDVIRGYDVTMVEEIAPPKSVPAEQEVRP